MAESIVKYTNLHISTRQGISSGFVAPSDGFVLLTCTSTGGNNWFYTSHGNISMSGGLTQSASFPIIKGETFTVTNYSDGSRVGATFIPFQLGGAVIKKMYSLLFKNRQRRWA